MVLFLIGYYSNDIASPLKFCGRDCLLQVALFLHPLLETATTKRQCMRDDEVQNKLQLEDSFEHFHACLDR